MNSLRSSQLSAMLFFSAAFTILCQTASWTMEGIFGTGIAVAVQFLLCVPIFLLYRQGFSLSDGDVNHRLLSTLLLGYLLVRGGVSFVRLQRASDALTLPVSGKFFAAALIALVCIYTASLGIRALARSSTLILGLLLFALAVLLLGAVPQAEPQNLSLSTDDTIFRGFLREMACADELPLLLLLFDQMAHRRVRSTLQFLAGKLGLFAFLALLGMAVLGDRMAHSPLPFFSTISVSQPFSTQRADALYLVIFVMLCVLRITLFTVFAARCLAQLLPHLQYASTICLGGMLAISAAAAHFSISAVWQIAAMVLFTSLIPLGLLLRQKFGGKTP